MELGKGKRSAEILSQRKSVTEGVETAPAVVELARRLKVELPICETVLELVEGRLDTRAAVGSLLSRPFKGEN
jgi:glycerol-3-phosphate dehydrogenase (NAD(P)+)